MKVIKHTKKSEKIAIKKQTDCQADSIDKLSWYTYLGIPSILSIITFLFYAPSRNFDFQFDDIANITKWYDIRHNTLWNLFFQGPRWISRWLNSIHYSIGKFEPFTYRLANIIQHIVIGIIVYYFFLCALRHLRKKSFFRDNAVFVATLTSALFMLHPVQTQTVSYVIQGKLEGVATFFIALLVLCFWFFATTTHKMVKLLLGVFFLCLAALSTGSKEIAIVGPLLVMLVDWFFVSQGTWNSFKKNILFHATNLFFVISLYMYLLDFSFFKRVFTLQWETANNLGNVITSAPLEHITPYWYLISEFKVILHYIAIFFWPFNISVEYDWILSKSFFAPDCLIPLIILMVLCALIGEALRKNPASLFAFGMLWFFICVLPRSSLISSAELIVDYKTYAASIGLLFVLSCALVYGASKISKAIEYVPQLNFLRTKKAGTVLTSFLCFFLGFLVLNRNTVWRTGIEFWSNMLKNAPGKARIYNNYGVELSQKLHKFQESIPYFKKAIAMDSYYPDPRNNLAVVYASLGKFDDAINEIRQSLRINPNYAEGYSNLAAFYLHKKDLVEAEKCLNHALRIRPSYGKAYFNRFRVYAEQGKIDLALADLKSACTRADLDNDFGFSIYGKFALEHKYFDDAIFAFKKFVECCPSDPEGYFNLGNAYHLSGNFEQAIWSYEQNLKLNPKDVRSIFNIGESYFKLNELGKALQYFGKINVMTVPQAGLRMADCHLKIGNRDRAETILRGLEKLPIADNIRARAHQLLVSIKAKSISTCA